MIDTFLPLMGFALATSITPGPNNMMLLASGVNFGFRRTIPHMLGISLGHGVMVLVMGLGLAALLAASPQLMLGLKLAAVVYVAWLAWKIAHAGAPKAGAVGSKPLTGLQAAAFQWINPKAIAMAMTAITVYGGAGSFGDVLAVAAVFSLINLPSVALWCIAGDRLRAVLHNPRWLRAFNWTMAALLVVSMIPVLWA
jgi:threonine/homoserine/homoserine lactone efflux protein